ncbi:mucin-5AC-like isoform X2 [Penaeus japonicus]|uniref:mucin-5AC-like isoform X2 n=1 Tax=Penaeus japonicus TaxID=27405 RepID=UPI001C71526A|nr:mucin-5AC-like isoform X2 [Penaeus japonicus]
MMGWRSPVLLPLLLASMACRLSVVAQATPSVGAPGAGEAGEDIDVEEMLDIATELRRLAAGPQIVGRGNGESNGTVSVDDPPRLPMTSRRSHQQQKYSPDELALGLQNSDYEEKDASDEGQPKPSRTVAVIAQINKLSRIFGGGVGGKRARTLATTSSDPTTMQADPMPYARGRSSALNFSDYSYIDLRSPSDTTEQDDEVKSRTRQSTLPPESDSQTDAQTEATHATPSVADTSGSESYSTTTVVTLTTTMTTTATSTLVVTNTVTTTATETVVQTSTTVTTRETTVVETLTTTESETLIIAVTTTDTDTEVVTTTSTVTATTISTQTTTVTTSAPSSVSEAATATQAPSSNPSKAGPEITPGKPVPPSGWLYGSLAFAALGLVLMVAGSVWLVITFVRKTSLNNDRRRGIL